MVLDPIPQSLPVHFFGSRPQPPTSHLILWQQLKTASHLKVFKYRLKTLSQDTVLGEGFRLWGGGGYLSTNLRYRILRRYLKMGSEPGVLRWCLRQHLETVHRLKTVS